MSEIEIAIKETLESGNYGNIYKILGRVKVESATDESELIGFLKAGIEAYQDWKINGE